MHEVIITGTISLLTLAGGVIGVWVTANSRIVKSETEVAALTDRVDKLEARMSNFEDKIFSKLDSIQETINEIKLQIAKK